MKLLQVLALSLGLSVLPAHGMDTLRVNISEGYLPVLLSLKPRLTEQLNANIEIVGKPNTELYNDFIKEHNTADIVVFVENPAYGTPQLNSFLKKKSQIVSISQVVLWCPNIYLPKRVSLLDTLTQANITSIALPSKSSMINTVFTHSLPKVPATTQIFTSTNGLTAWRMARNKQVQCAVTIDKWLNPNEQFVYVSNEEIVLRGYINPSSKVSVKAQQTLAMLSSPLIKPMMIRISNSDLVQNLPQPKKLESVKKIS